MDGIQTGMLAEAAANSWLQGFEAALAAVATAVALRGLVPAR